MLTGEDARFGWTLPEVEHRSRDARQPPPIPGRVPPARTQRREPRPLAPLLRAQPSPSRPGAVPQVATAGWPRRRGHCRSHRTVLSFAPPMQTLPHQALLLPPPSFPHFGSDTAGPRGRRERAARFPTPRFPAVPERPWCAGRAWPSRWLRAGRAERAVPCRGSGLPAAPGPAAPVGSRGALSAQYRGASTSTAGPGSGRALPAGRAFLSGVIILPPRAISPIPGRPRCLTTSSVAAAGDKLGPCWAAAELPGVSVSRLRPGFARSRSSRGGKRPPVGGGAGGKRKPGGGGAAAGRRAPSRGG